MREVDDLNPPQPVAAPTRLATAAAALLALAAFSANSLLCRAALGVDAIDAASFCALRIVSGALFLGLLVSRELNWRDLLPSPSSTLEAAVGDGRLQAAPSLERSAGDWIAACALFIYAIAFSWAYRHLTAGTGALILFGSVQVTMFVGGWRRGERPSWREGAAWLVALGGLVHLVWPRVSAPPLIGSALMGAAGAAWGVYSLRGRGVARPVVATAGNFLRAAPLAIVVWLLSVPWWRCSMRGATLALVSGVLTSGVGYVIWYRALRGLTAVRAAVVQLAVPVLTAAAGVLFLGEQLSWHLLVAGSIVLGGIALAIVGRIRR